MCRLIYIYLILPYNTKKYNLLRDKNYYNDYLRK